jgi:GNAT superfamily N-acetyltransferase
MDIGHLTVETEPAFVDVQFLEDRLYEYNTQQTGVDDGQWLALFLRDDHGTIQAGLKGWTWCGSCYIQTVWVHPDLRGQDIGSNSSRQRNRKPAPVGATRSS